MGKYQRFKCPGRTCTAATPTPPPAPSTSRFWPACSLARSSSARCAVPNATGSPAAFATPTPSDGGAPASVSMTLPYTRDQLHVLPGPGQVHCCRLQCAILIARYRGTAALALHAASLTARIYHPNEPPTKTVPPRMARIVLLWLPHRHKGSGGRRRTGQAQDVAGGRHNLLGEAAASPQHRRHAVADLPSGQSQYGGVHIRRSKQYTTTRQGGAGHELHS